MGNPMNADEELEQKARDMAHGLGISVYIRDGRIWQHGPGLEIIPDKSAKPTKHDIDIIDKGVPGDGD